MIIVNYPFADGTFPSDDGRLKPTVRLNVSIVENGATFNANTIFDDNISTNDHIRSDSTVFAYFSCWILEKKKQ